MAMFVWADGTVTGSVNVAELESIQKAMKGVGKSRLADLPWPIESAAQLADVLASNVEPEPPKAAKASTKKEDN